MDLTNNIIKIQNLLEDSNFICFVIPSLFSENECNELINQDIKNSFQKSISNYPTYYRNNDRFLKDDENLAYYLFQKVKPYLPETIEVTSKIDSENGIWKLKELNSRIRFCKYSKNQYFHKHLDGIHYRDEKTQSKLTFMIYLNSSTEFKGGRTLFFKSKESNEIWATYLPKQGDLIVFDHNVWHEGEVLTEGEKFVLRSDILYSKNENILKKEAFEGHLGYIWSLLKFEENTILSGGRDKEIKIWTNEGKLKKCLNGHQNSILCIEKLSENVFITGSRDQQIIVWKYFEIFNKISIHSAIVLSLCKIDEKTFASSSGDNKIKITNIDGKELKTLNEHKNWVWQVIKLDENILASCSEDKSIKIWNCKLENSINTFHFKSPIISLSYNSQTKQLINGNLDGEISIQNLSNDFQQQKIKTFKAHNGIIRTIKVIDNKRIVSGGEDNKVKIWDYEGNLKSEYNHQNFVQSVVILNSNLIISASYDGTIKTWKLMPV